MDSEYDGGAIELISRISGDADDDDGCSECCFNRPRQFQNRINRSEIDINITI